MRVVQLNSTQFFSLMNVSHEYPHDMIVQWLGITIGQKIEGFTWLAGRTFMVY
jgi:hypothetical protein